MCEVLDELQKYIPTKDCVTTYDVLEGEQQPIEVCDSKQYKVLTGGDQYSVVRYRSHNQYVQIMTWKLNGLKDLSLLQRTGMLE